jgi:RimJ/RimL family protein N-acetyltransferase
MLLRPVSLQDAPLLLDWRNDPLTRENSFQTNVITLDVHLRWLQDALQNPKRKLFMGEENGKSLGIVRGDFSEEGCELSWTIAPEHRGKGFGKEIVRLAIMVLRPQRFFARIKPGNVASERIAQFVGLALTAETKWEAEIGFLSQK